MKLTPREYQRSIYQSIMEKGNTLVVLPTGLGKTLIALMLIAQKMKDGRCLFMTPTKPLARQHFESVKGILELSDKNVSLVTGETSPEKRKEQYKTDVVISTPQTIRNDLDKKRLGTDFALCIIDEAHRAVGDYAYVPIAAALKNSLIVALTASPGGKRERIQEVLENLHIKNIEIRTHFDSDVSEYVQKSSLKVVPVMLSPTLRVIKAELDKMVSKYARSMSAMGLVPPIRHKGLFLKMRERIVKMTHGMKYRALVHYSILLHLLHMSELLETQGVYPLQRYMLKLSEKTGKSAIALLKEPGMARVKELSESGEEHPKMDVLLRMVKQLGQKKAIVFAQYRDQIARIEQMLQQNGVSARQFVGKKDGFTRKAQEKTIEDFRAGLFSVLVASSIGEEGLDIPAVDSVIFYEPIPSEIRSIQRRGRAARLKEGEITILMTKGTRDEYYANASKRKEEKMKDILQKMQRKLSGEPVQRGDSGKKRTASGQSKISEFF
ncbi:MAG: DEAD/DEAH box helicase [Candidatus Micrarchaeota archaeon]